MIDGEKTIVPLDDAHTLLSALGIGPEDRGYQRWRRDDGFRLVDFEDVLGASPVVFSMDWRGWLQDAVDTILNQLKGLGVDAVADTGDEGDRGTIKIGEHEERIEYVPADEDDFDSVIAAVNRLIVGRGQYRKFRSCEGSDGWWYALLTDQQWGQVQEAAPNTVDLRFVSVS